MTHEKLCVREDGSQVKIGVRIRPSGDKGFDYCHSVFTPKGKNWEIVWADEWNDNRHLKLPHEALQTAQEIADLKYVTKEEIYQAKLELWEKLKPTEG